MKETNPFRPPKLPATPFGRSVTDRGAPFLYAWVVPVQMLSIMALGAGLLGLESSYSLRPGPVRANIAMVLGCSAALAIVLLFLGPFLWFSALLRPLPPSTRRAWWFVLLEPVLWLATLGTMWWGVR